MAILRLKKPFSDTEKDCFLPFGAAGETELEPNLEALWELCEAKTYEQQLDELLHFYEVLNPCVGLQFSLREDMEKIA